MQIPIDHTEPAPMPTGYNGYRMFEFTDNRGRLRHATFTCDVHVAVCALDMTAEISSIEWCHKQCVKQEMYRLHHREILYVAFPVREITDGSNWDFQIDRR